MKKLLFFIGFMASVLIVQAQKSDMGQMVKEENVSYTYKSENFSGFVAYDEHKKGKLPVVLVIPEWWGNNEYAHHRAKMLAELGYFAFAVDMYGDGKIAPDPKAAMAYSAPFYKNPSLGKERIEAAIEEVKKYPTANLDKLAAIGYCFGGSMALNAIKLGVPFKGVVSFHGGLATVPAEKGVVKGRILVCHGGADKFVSQADQTAFKRNLDSVGVKYDFKVYAGATHAFTNPDATAIGQKFSMPIEYNKAADEQSWADMKAFFKKIF